MKTDNAPQSQAVPSTDEQTKQPEQKKLILKPNVVIVLVIAVVSVSILTYFLYNYATLTTSKVRQGATPEPSSNQSTVTLSPTTFKDQSVNTTTGKIAPKNTILYANEVSQTNANGRG